MTKWIAFLFAALTLTAAPPDPAVVKEVLAANDSWREAMMKKDAAALDKLLHEDLAYTHSSAMLQNKATVIKSTLGPTNILAIDFSEVTVGVYGNTALIRANVMQRNSANGKSTDNHLNVLHVWIKGPGGWQMVARQATMVSPPTPAP